MKKERNKENKSKTQRAKLYITGDETQRYVVFAIFDIKTLVQRAQIDGLYMENSLIYASNCELKL